MILIFDYILALELLCKLKHVQTFDFIHSCTSTSGGANHWLISFNIIIKMDDR